MDRCKEWIKGWAGKHAKEIIREYVEWKKAINSVDKNPIVVDRCLRKALKYRGLGDWETTELKSDYLVMAAWENRSVWTFEEAWATENTWMSNVVHHAIRACNDHKNWFTLKARSKWENYDMYAALVVYYAALMGWIDQPKDFLTVGIREAYSNGLTKACPVGAGFLGWSVGTE